MVRPDTDLNRGQGAYTPQEWCERLVHHPEFLCGPAVHTAVAPDRVRTPIPR